LATKKMKVRSTARIFVFIAAALGAASGCHYAVNLNLAPQPQPLSEVVISGKGENRVLLIPVDGLISSIPGKGMWGRGSPSMLAYITEQLDAARKDKRIKAVVLKIDSPGGVVSSCDAIHEELTRYKRDMKIPIVAQQMSMATSGGYYLSTVADMILAQPTTVTGSIGVIMLKLNAQGLLSKIGVADDSVFSGESKDILSVFKQMNPAERTLLQGILDTMHKKFIEVTLQARKQVKDPATTFDGRVFIGQQAVERNLVDKLAYLPDAFEEAKKLAGLTEATIIRLVPSKTTPYNAYTAGGDSGPPQAASGIGAMPMEGFFMGDTGPQFLYLWGL